MWERIIIVEIVLRRAIAKVLISFNRLQLNARFITKINANLREKSLDGPLVNCADAHPWEPAGRTLKNCNDPRSQLSENHTAASLADIRATAIYLSPSCIPLYPPIFFTEHKRFLRCTSWGSCCGIKLNIIVKPGKEYDAEFRRSASDIWEEYMHDADKSFNSDESTKLWEF